MSLLRASRKNDRAIYALLKTSNISVVMLQGKDKVTFASRVIHLHCISN